MKNNVKKFYLANEILTFIIKNEDKLLNGELKIGDYVDFEEAYYSGELQALAFETPDILPFFPDEYRDAYWEKLVDEDLEYFEYFSDKLRNDIEVIKNRPGLFPYSGDEARKNVDLVLSMIEEDPFYFDFADESIKTDPRVLNALRKPSRISSREDLAEQAKFERMSEKEYLKYLKSMDSCLVDELPTIIKKYESNENFLIKLLKHSPKYFKVLNEEQRSNYKLLRIVLKEDGDLFKYAGNKVKNDKKFLLEVLKKEENETYCGDFYKYFSPSLFTDKTFAKKVLEIDSAYLYAMPDEFKKDMELVEIALRRNGCVIEYADKSLGLNDNERMAQIAISSNPWSYKYFSNRIKANPKYAALTIETCGDEFDRFNFENLDPDIKVNKKVLFETLSLLSEKARINFCRIYLYNFPRCLSKDRDFADSICMIYIDGIIDNKIKKQFFNGEQPKSISDKSISIKYVDLSPDIRILYNKKNEEEERQEDEYLRDQIAELLG